MGKTVGKSAHRFQIRRANLGDLDEVIANRNLLGQELRFTLGAFSRVLPLDKLS